MTRASVLSWLIAPVIIACSTEHQEHRTPGIMPSNAQDVAGGESENESCGETVHRVSLNDSDALGFSANDMVSLASARDANLSWAGGATATVRISVRSGETASLIKVVRPKASLINCVSRLELPVQLHLVTSDGVFDGMLDIVLKAASKDVVFGSATVPLDKLQGTFDVSKIYGKLELILLINTSAMEGSLADVREDRSGDGASIHRDLIASW